MKIRFKEGYKNHLQKRIKEKKFKRKIKNEYFCATKQYYVGCTPRGYYIDERGIIKQINKYTRRYNFKTPRHYRRLRRRCFNKNAEDINITSFGRNYHKISSKNI